MITFDHLLDEGFFTNVKKRFLQDDRKYDHLRSGLSDIKVDIKEDEIFVIEEEVVSISEEKDFDPKTGEEIFYEVYSTEPKEMVLNFTNDFLLPKIEKLSDHYKNSFENDLDEKNIFSENAIKGFSEKELRKLNIIKEQISKSTHLNKTVKDKSLEVIDDIYEFISNEHYQKSKAIPQKIPLNLNKNEVITLFRLFRENELITDSLKPTDLARLIEQNFTYYDSKEQIYKDIKNARKSESKLFGSIPEKSATNSLNQLEKIFHDKDFFSI